MRAHLRASRRSARRASLLNPEPALEAEVRSLLQQDRARDAVALALKGGPDEFAAEILAKASLSIVRASGDFDFFFDSVERLEAVYVARWPELDAAAIWALTLSGRLRLASIRLDELEARIPRLLQEGRSFIVDYPRTPFDRNDPQTGMQCWAGLMRALIASFAGESERALKMAVEWRQSFPRATEYDLATMHCATAHARVMLDRFAEAEDDGLAALATFREEKIDSGLVWSAVCVAYPQIFYGRVAEANRLIEDTDLRLSADLKRPTRANGPLRTVRTHALFEAGDLQQALEQAQARLDSATEPPIASFNYSDLAVAVRALLALGRPAQALALFDRNKYPPPAEAAAWWNRRLALERARTAAVTGEVALLAGSAPSDLRDLMGLIADCRKRPTPVLLRPLRVLAQQAEDARAGDALALFLFLKARVEHDTGNALQARRTVTQLLTSALLRERVGSLASLAPGLQPMFNEALRALLQDPPTATESMRRLATILGQTSADAPSTESSVKLSRRERQIAMVLFEGLSNRDIAERLHLTEQTVKWHLWNLFQKLGVHNRTGAMRALMKQGFAADS